MQLYAILGLFLMLGVGAWYVDAQATARAEGERKADALEYTQEAYARAERNRDVAQAENARQQAMLAEQEGELSALRAKSEQDATNRERIATLEAELATAEADDATIAGLEAELTGLRAITAEGAKCVPGCLLD